MIPEKFLLRMKELLGEDFDAFANALERPSVRAVRVNTTKTTVDTVLSECELGLTPIPYTEVGFILRDAEGIGNGAAHHAGMYYVQDPGAMATVSALEVKEGWWVLDTCAAPGGKSSQLASLIGESGFILSNEYVPKRAKIIVSNLERLGIRNAIVTSLDTAEFPKMFSEVFDLVLCDAPCSGEGMFRKSDEAIEDWSEENVRNCAERQAMILGNSACTVKVGGYLLYSTCTYSREENEDTVAAFLNTHPDFELCEVRPELIHATRDGIGEGMEKTRRFYPHVSEGEGQFIALMKRVSGDGMSTILYKEETKAPSKDEASAVRKFFTENLTEIPDGRLIKQGDYIALISHGCPVPKKSVFMPGVIVGEVTKGLLFPHHQFFSAYGRLFKRQENLGKGDPRVAKYLRGEEIEAVEIKDGGWCAVSYLGATVGGGKMSGGRIKNHYPKGLRNK